MNNRQLTYALAVREDLSFSRAGEKLCVSQPAVSEQISLLEEELGFPLFKRTGRGIAVTESGQIFLSRAEEIMNGFTGLKDLARRLKPGHNATFSIGMSTSLVEFLFPVIVDALQSRTPDVQISFMSATAPKIYSLAMQEVLDIGFTVEFSTKNGHPVLTWEEIAYVEMALLVRPDHAMAARRQPIDLAEIADQPLIMNDPLIGYGLLVQSMFKDRGVEPTVVATADRPAAIKTMIRSGMGVAIMPSIVAASEIKMGQLVRLPIRPKREVSLCLVRLTKNRGAYVERAITHIRDTLLKSNLASPPVTLA
jgi:DNA-binding transcriptional LysR family regulator